MEKMKTLYVNCPTKYRNQEDIDKTIEKLHKIAEITFGEKLSVINVPGHTEEKNDLKELAEQIRLVSEADYCIGLRLGGLGDVYKTVWHIDNLAYEYGIPCIDVDTANIAPDIVDIDIKMRGRNRRF
jgi:hypothetical protein